MEWSSTLNLLSSLSCMQLIVIAVLTCVVYIFYTGYVQPFQKVKQMGLKGPFPKPLVGNFFDYGPWKQHTAQVQLQQLYGNVYGSLFLQIPTIWVSDPEILKAVTVQHFSNFPNRYAFTPRVKPFDLSVIELKDQDWKRVRNIVIQTFTTSKLKIIYPFIDDASNRLIDDFSKAEGHDQTIGIKKIFSKYTMEVILATAFGIEVDDHKAIAKICKAIDSILGSRPTILHFLLFVSPSLFQLIEPLFGETVNSLHYVMKVTNDVIQQRKSNIQAGIPCRKDLLQLIIEAGKDENLTNDEIISQAFIFLAAGHESTAHTLTFACYLLAINPDIQQKLFQEIDSTFSLDHSINYDILFELPYLDMVVSETLRMFPSGYFTNRDIKQDKVINGVRFVSGAMVGVPVYALHHNPKLWPNPDKFMPERFTPEEKAKRHPCSYFPFGSGPRNCLGMRLASLEIKLALVKVVQNMELVATDQTEIPLQLKTGGSLGPANEVYLGIRKR